MAEAVAEQGQAQAGLVAVQGPVSPLFVLAGQATFTVSNPKGEHYTYKVTKVQDHADRPPVWFAGLLTGSDNTQDYSYLGMVLPNQMKVGPPLRVKLTARSKFQASAKPVLVLAWALRVISTQGGYQPPQGYQILHSGHCGRCGRLLTVPASIQLGLGPECASKG